MQKASITVTPNTEGCISARQFLDEHLPADCASAFQIAFDELFSNIEKYAPECTEVALELTQRGTEVKLRFISDGAAYNPLDYPEPDITQPLEERAEGGLGIYLVKRLMDRVSYRYEAGYNILELSKSSAGSD